MRKRVLARLDLRIREIVAGCLILMALAACEEQKEAAPPPAPPEVVLAEVSEETVPIVLQASGTLKAVKNVEIIPRVTGYIFERYFTEGSFVEKDAPLYLIDPRPFEDQVAQLKSELEGQQATLEYWKSEEKRYSKLAKQGAASQEQAEGARAKMQTSMAEIAATEVKIHNAELDLSYTRINAPFYGRAQQTRINVGNLVTQEQDVLTSVVTMDPIYVVFHLSRSQVFDVQKLKRQGRAFEIDDMVVEMLLPDGEVYDKKGKIDFISTEIDPTTDSVMVRGVFDNPRKDASGGFDFIPGQYAPVYLRVGETPGALVIPQTAVVETQAGTQVYVVGPDNKAEVRMIEVGATYGANRVVTKGLKSGEKVVAVGVQKVRSGNEVKPVETDKAGQDEKAEGSG